MSNAALTPRGDRLAQPGAPAGRASESAGEGRDPRRAPGWEGHAVVLVVCLAAVTAALLLQPAAPGGRLSLAGFSLPMVCAFQSTTGLPCPGCGLTRSWVAAIRGDWASSLSHHLLGAVLLLYAFAQAVRHALWLAVPRGRQRVERVGGALDRGLIVLGVALLALWVPVLIGALGGPG